MKKKNRLYATIVCAVLLGILLVVLLLKSFETEYDTGVLSDTYVSVAELQQELSFDVYGQKNWEDYFAAYKKDYLTGEMLTGLLEQLGISGYIDVDVKKNQTISRQIWNEVYEQILASLDMKGEVSSQTLLILEDMEESEGWLLVCNQGDYSTVLPETFFDTWMAYDVYVLNGSIIGVIGISDEENEISNVYLKNSSDESIAFLFSGAEYQVFAGDEVKELKAGVCDLIFVDGRLTGIRRKQDTIQGDLLSYDDAYIEIQGYGKISHNGKIPIYRTYGEVMEKSISDVVLGNMELEYVTAGNTVCAILIRQPASIENIRVLLLADDGTKFRSEVYLTADTDARIKTQTADEMLKAGDVLAVKEWLKNGDDMLSLTPEGSGRVYICNEQGERISNGYYGEMEVRIYEEGYTLVNQLPFEQYLYAVVPSEMPVSYEMEALKAQAVCARSYAYMQLLKGNLAAYGAHMDDSTSYQVYNKVAETEESIAAVDETHGEILSYQGEVMEAFFFSTSAGYTDTAVVWNNGEDEKYGYLQAFCLNETEFDGNLANEADFARYIKAEDEKGYDSDAPYYRWQVKADYSGKTEEINEILAARHEVSPDSVVYLKKDGKTSLDDTSSMGKIKNISVEERSSSGSILTLRLTYKKGIVLVKNEYNIRKILAVGATEIQYKDGTKGTVSSLLPSAFTTVEKQKDGTWLLCGGGYGHGLGMSQNGANGMAKAGMDYEEILHCFYKDAELVNMEEKGE